MSKIETGMKRGATARCDIKTCMGKPKTKDLMTSQNVEPYEHVVICRNCFCVHEYKPLGGDVIEELQRDPNEPRPERKRKKKTSQYNLDIE